MYVCVYMSQKWLISSPLPGQVVILWLVVILLAEESSGTRNIGVKLRACVKRNPTGGVAHAATGVFSPCRCLMARSRMLRSLVRTCGRGGFDGRKRGPVKRPSLQMASS